MERLFADYRKGIFPIGLWVQPPPAETNEARYREIRDAGINLILSTNGFDSLEDNERMLAICDEVGLKAIVRDNRIDSGISRAKKAAAAGAAFDVQADAHSVAESLARDYARQPSVYGFMLMDEPSTDSFELLGRYCEAIQKVQPDMFGYVNLFPTYASETQLGVSSYDDYLRSYMDIVKPAVLSYDHYPMLDAGATMTDDFYINLKAISDAAARAKVPFWVFLQSVGYNGHRTPNENELRWQIYNYLAHGCKGLMYFTYWTVVSHENFTKALIDLDGRRTHLYYAAAKLNKEVASLGTVLSNLDLQSVYISSRIDMPAGTVPFMPNSLVEGVEGTVVFISFFKDGKGEDYVMVTNKSYAEKGEVRLVLGAGVALQEVDKGNAASPALSLKSAQATVSLVEGEGRLFKISKIR